MFLNCTLSLPAGCVRKFLCVCFKTSPSCLYKVYRMPAMEKQICCITMTKVFVSEFMRDLKCIYLYNLTQNVNKRAC